MQQKKELKETNNSLLDLKYFPYQGGTAMSVKNIF